MKRSITSIEFATVVVGFMSSKSAMVGADATRGMLIRANVDSCDAGTRFGLCAVCANPVAARISAAAWRICAVFGMIGDDSDECGGGSIRFLPRNRSH